MLFRSCACSSARASTSTLCGRTEHRPGFYPAADGRYLLDKSDVLGDFGINKSGSGLYGEREVTYKNFTTTAGAGQCFQGAGHRDADSAESQPDSFWVANRADTLTKFEVQGLCQCGQSAAHEILPAADGLVTFCWPGTSRPALSRSVLPAPSTVLIRWKASGCVWRQDHYPFQQPVLFRGLCCLWFQGPEMEILPERNLLINNKSIYSFPQEYHPGVVSEGNQDIPGQSLQFVQEDNFLLSFKRGNNDKWTYNNNFRLNMCMSTEPSVLHLGFAGGSRPRPAPSAM
jgi:hypothetical protein